MIRDRRCSGYEKRDRCYVLAEARLAKELDSSRTPIRNAIKLGLSNEARERMQSDVSGMSDIISVWTADERTAGGKRNSR